MLLKVMGKLSYALCYAHVEFAESTPTLRYHSCLPYQMVDIGQCVKQERADSAIDNLVSITYGAPLAVILSCITH